MWESNHKEGWTLKNLCFWTVVLEKTLESPLDSKEIKPVNPKGNQRWIFIGRTDTEAPILWPPDVNSQLIGKDPDDGKDWRKEEKGATENEMFGWHYWLNGHDFKQTPGVGIGQGSRVVLQSMGLQSQTWLSDWTTTNNYYFPRNKKTLSINNGKEKCFSMQRTCLIAQSCLTLFDPMDL